MKSLKNEIRKIILEQIDELFAEEEESTRLSRDSIDDQVDSFLIKFESDSIKDESQEDEISKSLSEMSLRTLILKEQDAPALDQAEEEAAPAEEEVEEEEEEISKPADSADVEVSEPADPPKLPIDVDAFIKRVARLAFNADALLDIQTVIVNRALNFLKDNYDEHHVEKAIEILDSQFDFNIGGKKEAPEAPYAAGAWAGGTGGPGGGG
tara:strand:- start:554 stop:1183 length:630 start_codon:yes stop_codon:yes gene_type:complete